MALNTREPAYILPPTDTVDSGSTAVSGLGASRVPMLGMQTGRTNKVMAKNFGPWYVSKYIGWASVRPSAPLFCFGDPTALSVPAAILHQLSARHLHQLSDRNIKPCAFIYHPSTSAGNSRRIELVPVARLPAMYYTCMYPDGSAELRLYTVLEIPRSHEQGSTNQHVREFNQNVISYEPV